MMVACLTAPQVEADEDAGNENIVDDEANEGDADATDSSRKEKQEEEVLEFTLFLKGNHSIRMHIDK